MCTNHEHLYDSTTDFLVDPEHEALGLPSLGVIAGEGIPGAPYNGEAFARIITKLIIASMNSE
jgi:hypothetical protein